MLKLEESMSTSTNYHLSDVNNSHVTLLPSPLINSNYQALPNNIDDRLTALEESVTTLEESVATLERSVAILGRSVTAFERFAPELKRCIEELRSRNRRVESKKDWEAGWWRWTCVAITTFAVESLILYTLDQGVSKLYEGKKEPTWLPLAQAIVPTAGYVISTIKFDSIRKLVERLSQCCVV